MGVIASGPPFAKPFDPLCKCGWMWSYQCERNEKCGLNQGMPEYKDIPSPKESSGNCGVGDASPKRHPPIPSAIGWEAVLGDTGFHTPYESLPDEKVDLNKVCREVVDDLVKDSKSTQVGGTHYAEMAVQPWSAMKAWMSPEEYIGYHVGTVIGYLSRHKKKGGEVDIDKALHHLKELSRYLKEDAEYPY